MSQYNKDKEGFFPEDAMMLEYLQYAMKCPNRMIAEWYALTLDINNILTAMIARKNGWNVGDYIQGDNEVTEMIRHNNTKDFDLSLEFSYVKDLMKIVLSCAEGIAFLHQDSSGINVKLKILLDHLCDLLVADNLHIRVTHHQLLDRFRMIRLHMMYYQIIQCSAAQYFL